MKILISFAFILAFYAVGFGQTILTETGKELKKVEDQITSIEKKLSEDKAEKERLLIRFDAAFPEVQKVEARIETLTKILIPLTVRKTELLKTKLTQTLPNNNTELLKIIVLQNERIIELLEKLTDHQN